MGLEICNGTDVGSVLATSLGTAMSAGAGNAYGAYVQLSASTAADTCWMLVQLEFDSNQGGSQGACKIAVGAGGSEKDIAVDLLHQTNFKGSSSYLFPICIPAGTRVSAAGAAGGGASHLTVKLTLFDGAFTNTEGASGVDSIGYDAVNVKGTPLTPNATADTKGSYAQLTASTTRDYIGFMLYVDQQNGGGANAIYVFDVAVGGAGAEKDILPNCIATVSAPNQAFTGPFWINIPAGTRIAARAQAEVASGAIMGLTLYGIYQ